MRQLGSESSALRDARDQTTGTIRVRAWPLPRNGGTQAATLASRQVSESQHLQAVRKRQALITRLVTFCSSEPDLDIAKICKPLLIPAQDAENLEGASEDMTGFVYLMKSGKY
jgi:hypothetical protein